MIASRVGAVGLAACAFASPALAGGFDRQGLNDYGLLFASDTYVIQAQAGFSNPDRHYSNAVGFNNLGLPAGGSTTANASDPYFRGSLAAKASYDDLSCMARLSEPWGLDNKISDDWQGRYAKTNFNIGSLGAELTCGYAFDIGDGQRIMPIAGIGVTWFDAKLENFIYGPALGVTGDVPNTLKLDKGDPGVNWVAGVAYEIPAMALRAQILYQSETSLDLNGTNQTGAASRPIEANFSMPQAVIARVQTGVAPNWLASLAVRWTDWSSLDGGLKITTLGAPLATLGTPYDDGWTVEAGVGHQISEKWSVGGSLTWDKGIGGGFADRWGLGGELAYNLTKRMRVGFQLGVAWLVSSAESSGSAPALVNYDNDDDFGYGAGIRLRYGF